MKEKRLKKQIKKFVSEFLALAMVMGMCQMPVYAGTEGAGVAPLAVTSPDEATPGETTAYDIKLLGETIEKTASGYAYLTGFDVAASSAYKYLQITYKGDITSLRMEFTGAGKTCWAAENAQGTFKTADGSNLTLQVEEPTTAVIDLEASGVDITKVTNLHLHYGGDAETSVAISDLRLMAGTVSNPQPYDIKVSNSTIEKTASGYAYLAGFDIAASEAYKYLQITYKGDITSLRMEFTGAGKTCWAAENAQGTFKTADGSNLTLQVEEPTTAVIDLEASGVDITKVTNLHLHYGGDAETSVAISDLRLMAGTVSNPQPYDIKLLNDAIEKTASGYAYLAGFDVAASSVYKYLQITYKGDITSLRMEFAGAGKTCWAAENAQGTLKTADGSNLTLQVEEPTTAVIDLEASGVDIAKVTNLHLHYGGDAETTVAISDLRLMAATVSNPSTDSGDDNPGGGEDPDDTPTVVLPEIPLNQKDAGKGGFDGAYENIQLDNGYKWLGWVEFKAIADYKYLEFTFTGDITYLRLEFAKAGTSDKLDPIWMNKEGHDGECFITKDGSDIPLVATEPTTVIIDLVKSGVHTSQYDVINLHYGDASQTGTPSFTIAGSKFTEPIQETPPAPVIKEAAKPSITANPAGASYTYKAAAKALAVTAASTDNGVLSYQWYSNTKDSVGGATPIANATGASYTPDTTKVGTTYYFCKVTNTNEKATVTKTAAAYSKTAKIVVTQAANKITGVASSYTKGIKDKAFTLKAKGQGKISYKTSNKKVATVTSKGKVTVKGYGKATITITAAGNAGYTKVTKKVTIVVAPKTALSKVKAQKKALKVTWKKDKAATGYKIQYTTDKKFKKSVKTITVKKASTTSYTIKKLAGNKKYYVRVSAYKKVGKTTVTSSWSKAKNAKTKK